MTRPNLAARGPCKRGASIACSAVILFVASTLGGCIDNADPIDEGIEQPKITYGQGHGGCFFSRWDGTYRIDGCREQIGDWDMTAGGTWRADVARNVTGLAFHINVTKPIGSGTMTFTAGNHSEEIQIGNGLVATNGQPFTGRPSTDGVIYHSFFWSACFFHEAVVDLDILAPFEHIQMHAFQFPSYYYPNPPDNGSIMYEPSCNGYWSGRDFPPT